ncbi:unnamed protein product [Blepharisma stoltei]|uniref:PPM-type phosphatase domain-containing protein n=1 Tax=Blepharisma stoltei TaxID=1481888 RepID=A0AAU9I7V2_9CILI|nr:unnamed protein product [Blepharisma stoltei]
MENKPIETRSRSSGVLPSRSTILREFNMFNKARLEERKKNVLNTSALNKSVVFKRKEFYTPNISPRLLNKTQIGIRNVETPNRLNQSQNVNLPIKETSLRGNNDPHAFARAIHLEPKLTNNSHLSLQNKQRKEKIKIYEESSVVELPSVNKSKRKAIKEAVSRNQSPLSNSVPEIRQVNIASKIPVRCAYLTKTGVSAGKTKANNQDAFILKYKFGQVFNQILLGVLDGHGIEGHLVSNFIKRVLPIEIESNSPPEVITNSHIPTEELHSKLKESITKGFLAANVDLSQNKTIDSKFSGTTVNLVLIRGKFCICANAGDSRAIIGRYENNRWTPIPLSNDHKPEVESERIRIEKYGGRVEPYSEIAGQFLGPQRVWLKNSQIPGLAMTRSLGDFIASQVGVIPDPEIKIHEMTKSDKFIVLATDGVWEFVSNEECVNLVGRFYREGIPESACNALMERALNYWKNIDQVVDDITIIVAYIK